MDERNGFSPEDRATDGVPETTDANQTLAQFFGNPREVIDRYTHCVLCGANLHFSHVTDFVQNLTQETAKCPECGIKVRRVVHRLQ